VEDRIYRSLRTAQERELQNHPTSAQPSAAPAPAPEAPAPTPAEAHPALTAHGPVRPVDPIGFRWFARGFSADRPRISIVGTLSLSVLISAGLFAAQMIVKPRHKHHGDDETVAADSNGAMRLAARSADDGDDSADPVSVPSHFRHVHAPARRGVHARTHAVALDEQPASEETVAEDSLDTSDSAPAQKQKAHRSAASSGSVQHAAEETDASQPGAVDGSVQSADQSVPAPSAACNHGCSKHNGADHSMAMPTEQVPAPEVPAAVSDHSAVQTNLGSNSGQSAFQAAAQPAAPTNSPAMDLNGSRWPAQPSATPPSGAYGTVQVSAEASTVGTPTLTIVPGRPDSLSVPNTAPAPRMQTIPQQAPADPAAVRSADASAAHPGQPANVYGLYQDHPDATAAVAAEKPQSAVSPFETLDHTKVMSFQFRNAPWSLVLAKFANATGLELRMQAMPDGTFNRWDSARYTPTQTLAILNADLAKAGCQAKVVGSALCIVAASPSDAAIQTSASSMASGPAAPPSSQLPQYPGVPAAAANAGAR
jgi:hypothetical protein